MLWLYWVAGAGSLAMGMYHIARGEMQRHRSWMSLNYGTVFGAPALRLFWGAYGVLTEYRLS